ncbi:uncharacterized protein B0I36DRAFT_325928 [Microdochium trichocladiopsis]|uniref:Uncharacterized protein n=1 Tax=Microdochium trichocladiopsis TaxID=1682393 RepID=A0A9P8Y6Y8_9PEZI|nr:uncharacterized protein B0I36DRAFT_325928 [Microdochium trichocladiopsis]KAH7029518.1 hypothetical protein B0I36DRAFT_325928 [Microdochium trichocladiopsis]
MRRTTTLVRIRPRRRRRRRRIRQWLHLKHCRRAHADGIVCALVQADVDLVLDGQAPDVHGGTAQGAQAPLKEDAVELGAVGQLDPQVAQVAAQDVCPEGAAGAREGGCVQRRGGIGRRGPDPGVPGEEAGVVEAAKGEVGVDVLPELVRELLDQRTRPAPAAGG